jgi:two-component system, OmpR family, KDP operon response regulator KdpE
VARKDVILLIDDDESFVTLIDYNLREAGYEVLAAYTGPEGLKSFFEHRPDLVLLDITLPGMTGWTLCQRLRELSDVPILMLTAQISREDIVRGLDMGADDYVTKPVAIEELLARIRARLRRPTDSQEEETRTHYADEALSIDLTTRRVLRDGQPVGLSRTEFSMLSMLMLAAPGVALQRDLLDNIWGSEYRDDVDFLRVYVWRLRKKIEPDPGNPVYILTEPGVGYRFAGKRS